jgi:hypothetical protein
MHQLWGSDQRRCRVDESVASSPEIGAHRVREGSRPLEEVVSFHCIPRERSVARTFSTTVVREPTSGIDTLTEYQFAGDSEVHGVPLVALADDRHLTPCRRPAPIVATDEGGGRQHHE